MKHKKLCMILIVALAATTLVLAGILCVLLTDRPALPPVLAVPHGIRLLDYWNTPTDALGLCDIEMGMTPEEIKQTLPELEGTYPVTGTAWIYFYKGQRAMIHFDSRNKVNGYVVYNEDRKLVRVNLVNSPNRWGQVFSAQLADADFERMTWFDLQEVYGLSEINSSSLGFAGRVYLDDGRYLFMEGPTVQNCSAYRNSSGSYFDDSILWRNNDYHFSIIGDTYMSEVVVYDLFKMEPTMRSSESAREVLLEISSEECDRKNSEYFLRWIKEHPPESWDPDYLNDWIDRYMPKDDESTEETSP